MNTRRAACSCGQLQVTIEGDPSRIALCHCLACQSRTGAVISNQARFRRDQVTISGKSTECADSRKRQRHDLSFLSDMRLNRVLGERRFSWTSKHRHWQLRRPKFPRANNRGMGAVTSPLGFLAARHAAQACGEAGVTTKGRSIALVPILPCQRHVRFGSEADICTPIAHVRFAPKATLDAFFWTTRLDASSLICFVPTLAFKFLVFPECWIVGRPLTKWRGY